MNEFISNVYINGEDEYTGIITETPAVPSVDEIGMRCMLNVCLNNFDICFVNVNPCANNVG